MEGISLFKGESFKLPVRHGEKITYNHNLTYLPVILKGAYFTTIQIHKLSIMAFKKFQAKKKLATPNQTLINNPPIHKLEIQ